MPFLTNIVSLNPAHGEVCSMQYNVIKVVSDLQQVCVFSCSSCFRHQQYWPPRYSWNIMTTTPPPPKEFGLFNLFINQKSITETIGANTEFYFVVLCVDVWSV
jgi:hypothetical protein